MSMFIYLRKQYYNNMASIYNFPLRLILCRVLIGLIVKLDLEYIGVYIGVYILYGSRVISASVIMATIMNLQLPVISNSSSYVEFGTSKMWV